MRIFSFYVLLNLFFPVATAFKNAPIITDPSSEWDSLVLVKANTAANVTYLTNTEKEVLFYINLARLDPKKFGDTYLINYVKREVGKETGFTRSLVRDLKKAKPMEALQPGNDLFLCASEHAIKSGKKGTSGHQELSKRMKTHAPTRNPYGENCDYGNENALDIVMSWLIDEGITSVMHRKNILDKDFTAAGISIQPHKKMKVNAVMCFGK
jgi:uncharacterized protein YkwD